MASERPGQRIHDMLRCPYCRGASTPLVSSHDFNRKTTPREFHYFSCAVCGLVFMHDIPQDLRPFYAGGYAEIPGTLAGLRQLAQQDLYRLEPVLRYKRAGRLLEIGPWRGVFCINAMDAGFNVSAIEMDNDCVQFLRDQVGVDAVQSMDPAATMMNWPQQFDVIALWHSLEHLREPWRVIQAAAARLAPGGILLIALPNIQSLEFSILKERWRHLDAPRHLYFYPAASLVALCRLHRLDLLELHTHDRLSTLMARETWLEWAKRWFGDGRNAIRVADRVGPWAARRERTLQHAGSNITAVFERRQQIASAESHPLSQPAPHRVQ